MRSPSTSAIPLMHLTNAVKAWNQPQFKSVLQAEIEQLPKETLPLQRGIEHGSYPGSGAIRCMIIDYGRDEERLWVKAGVFFTSIIAGCNCADDPTPPDEIPEYFEMRFTIDAATGAAQVTID